MPRLDLPVSTVHDSNILIDIIKPQVSLYSGLMPVWIYRLHIYLIDLDMRSEFDSTPNIAVHAPHV